MMHPIDSILHFSSPLEVEDIMSNDLRVYAYNKVVHIEKGIEGTAEVEVFNILGERITSVTFSDQQYELPIEHADGYYLIKVSTENKIVTEKVLIQ